MISDKDRGGHHLIEFKSPIPRLADSGYLY